MADGRPEMLSVLLRVTMMPQKRMSVGVERLKMVNLHIESSSVDFALSFAKDGPDCINISEPVRETHHSTHYKRRAFRDLWATNVGNDLQSQALGSDLNTFIHENQERQIVHVQLWFKQFQGFPVDMKYVFGSGTGATYLTPSVGIANNSTSIFSSRASSGKSGPTAVM
jgi:hypothetical protein